MSLPFPCFFTNHLQVFHCYWEGGGGNLGVWWRSPCGRTLHGKTCVFWTSWGICRGVHKVCFLKLKKARSSGLVERNQGVHWGHSRPPRKDGGKHGGNFLWNGVTWRKFAKLLLSFHLYEWSYGPLVISVRVHTLYACVKLCVSWVNMVICYWKDTIPRGNDHIFFRFYLCISWYVESAIIYKDFYASQVVFSPEF